MSWMQPGAQVSIRTNSNAHYNSMVWEVMSCDVHNTKVMLGNSQVDNPISVAVSKVFPLSLAPLEGCQDDYGDQFALQVRDLDYNGKVEQWCVSFLPEISAQNHKDFEDRISAVVDRWMPVPGLGGNSIMLRRHVWGQHDPEKLVLFPILNFLGLGIWFHSTCYGSAIELKDADIFKPCKQDQIWPYCAYCKKFLLPPDAHQCSNKHTGMLNMWKGNCPALREQLAPLWPREPHAQGKASAARSSGSEWRNGGRWL